MDLTVHKQEMMESMKEFIKILIEEHGYSLEDAKTLLISKAMDSAYEQSIDGRCLRTSNGLRVNMRSANS